MRYYFMRYPGGKAKAVTFSYDDGLKTDIRLLERLNHYGIKATLNINNSFIGRTSGKPKLTQEDIQTYILDAGHEVAVHGDNHRAPGILRSVDIIRDVLDCRLGLEKRFGRIVKGMAYPDSGVRIFQGGMTYQQVCQCLQDVGIVYARSLSGDNTLFRMPEDWYAWNPSAHHANPNVVSYAEEFVAIDFSKLSSAWRYPRLFYLWGHSYEFDNNNNWELLDTLGQILGGKEDTWYATNMEIYEYTKAYESLETSADGTIIYNPTLRKIWFEIDGKPYEIEPGQTLKIEE